MGVALNTPNDIEDALDNSLSWRRIELQALKAEILSAERKSPNSPLSRALSRSGVTMLYAHWEGFVKDACQSYVDFVAKRRLKFAELNDGLLSTVLIGLGRRALSGDEAGLREILNAIRKPEISRALIPKKTIVDTKSNLRFSVLSEILDGIGFPVDDFVTKNQLIDKTLCDGRNSVAHGRDYFPDPGSFEELHAEVLEMMERLRDIIMSNVRTQGYRYQLQSSLDGTAERNRLV
ncbi:hypothetical protein HS048_05005 [Planomonospora sp. ID91781]|uniref:MAE_28990/MAE_18760 family HEPN-like nuclease n=1 Tax=Planomonospora sp. ID91781 TaxID=2738135 RepID=UPI0018C3EC88|nr:MAE_28990/MAE_18760 family HEPN-like nuclease [Planomonospora sp. ID91781]MBG0820096.1 hypothetical protein [Planomonospora sp. ID91781]